MMLRNYFRINVFCFLFVALITASASTNAATFSQRQKNDANAPGSSRFKALDRTEICLHHQCTIP